MDWNVILLAFIAATPPTIMAWRASDRVEAVAVKVEEVHKATNGLTEKLGKAIEDAALLKGHVKGVSDEKNRKDLSDALIDKSRAEGVEAESARVGKVKAQDVKAVDPSSKK